MKFGEQNQNKIGVHLGVRFGVIFGVIFGAVNRVVAIVFFDVVSIRWKIV